MNTNFLIQEPEEAYRAKVRDFLTSHALADFRKCPELYRRKKVGLVPDEDRPAYVVGRAAHALALEGREAFEARFAAGGPINSRTGKPFGPNTQANQEWAADQGARGRQCLTGEQHALVEDVAAAVRAHPLVGKFLSMGIAEGVARAEYCGFPCQARLDWFHPQRGIVDLKTADDLTWFEADAKRYGYAHQLAFYRALIQRLTGNLFPVHLIGVEKKQPFRCGVWEVSDQTLAHCQKENEAAMARLAECEKEEIWPTGFESVLIFDHI